MKNKNNLKKGENTHQAVSFEFLIESVNIAQLSNGTALGDIELYNKLSSTV